MRWSHSRYTPPTTIIFLNSLLLYGILEKYLPKRFLTWNKSQPSVHDVSVYLINLRLKSLI